MSRKSHLLGGALCLAGGYMIGYGSGTQGLLGGFLGYVNSFVQAVPYLPNLVGQLSAWEWYLAFGLVLIIIGLLFVVTGGAGGKKLPVPEKKDEPKVIVPKPGSCRFCGADLRGSTTYCPTCGRSQV